MTTFATFSPSRTASPPFQFQATLDGQVFAVSAAWNVSGARWYVTVAALDGTPVVTRALAGSPTGFALAALSWSAGRVAATTVEPHGYRIGRPASLTVSGASPAAYNGLRLCAPTGPRTLVYDLARDPGTATLLGAIGYDLDLVGGVVGPSGTPFASTLVYRQPANRFEVSP